MPTSDVNLLRPQLRARAIAWLSACNDLILPVAFPGYKVRISDTLRDAGQQAGLHAAGLSDVTLGWHNFGLAFDFAVIDPAGHYVSDGSHPAYDVCGEIAVALGCHYPIILKNGQPDADHVEYHPGFTLAQLQAAEAAGKNLFT